MPMGADPDALREPIAALRAAADAAGKPRPEVITLAGVSLDDPERGRDELAALGEAGVDGVIQAGRYPDAATALSRVEALAGLRGTSP